VPEYHLGTSELEFERLAYQHQVWSDVSARLWNQAEIGRGQRVLDLGCGPGLATLDLAQRVTHSGQIYAMDASERFLAHLDSRAKAAGLQHITRLQGDVHQIDLPDDQVDVVFIRWLLCFVSDPARVLAECRRVLRRGGRLVAWDYYNYDAVGLFPSSPATDRLFTAYRESAVANGGSYDIGNQLPAMLSKLGMRISHLDTVNRVARPGSALWDWADLFHHSYVPKLVEQNLLSQDEADAFFSDWNGASAVPGAFFSPPPMLTVIACK
jgi:SAM-dependent methyltransferase